MTVNYEIRYATNPDDFRSYDTERIRKDFLVQGLMNQGQIKLVYSHYDRYIVGGAVPGKDNLKLDYIDPLKAEYFLERRELGIINVGGPGRVQADDEIFDLGYKDALYIGRGKKEVIFSNSDPSKPAHYYLNCQRCPLDFSGTISP